MLQGATLHEHGGHRATALVQLRFNDKTTGLTVRVGLEVKHFGLQQNGFQQLVEVGALECRNFNVENVAAHAFHHQVVLQQISAHAGGVDVGLVHLVDGNNDRNTCRLGVVDRFNRLRHHAVIGSHHQNGNVGGFRTTRTHGGEGFMARRVDEGDETTRRSCT